MNKVKIRLLASLTIIAVGIGGYFIFKNVYENKNDKTEKNSSAIIEKDNRTNEIPQNSTEINVAIRENFSEGVAWVKEKSGNYYLIDATGKAIFGLDAQKEDRIYDVDSYLNDYGIVSYHNDDSNTDYKKIFDKKGNMVYAEWDGTRAKHEIIAGPDDKGYILVNNLGKVESINLISGETVTNSAKWSSDTRKMESLGEGIFYNKYVGFFNASSGSSMPLEALDIYSYDAATNFTTVKSTQYSWSRFIDGKAIFVSGSHNYVVTNEGEATEIDKLKGYKLTIDNSMSIGVENSFNGKTVYGENMQTKDKGYFDLEGNKVVDLSNYNILYKYAMYNDKAVIILSTDELNKQLFTVIDKNGKELFDPIECNSYYELGNEIICGDYQILNYKGEILKKLSEYDWAGSFSYGYEDTITVCPKTIDLEANRMYLNSKMQEIKPYYENDLELK